MYDIIVNAQKVEGKNGKLLETVKEVFERAGKTVKFHMTEFLGHAKELARKITCDGKQHSIIAMGGDGTLHEVLNGVCDVSKCKLGVIPVGSGNDFATCVNLKPNSVKHAAEVIAYKEAKNIDYIELASGLRSINAVGMGIDVDILKCVYAGNMKGPAKYARALAKCLLKFKSCNFTVEYNGIKEEHYGFIVALGNGKQIGGGLKVFPDAEVGDGYMDVVIVDYMSKPAMIKAFVYLMLGKMNSIKGLTHVKTKRAVFKTGAEHYTIQAEGELYQDVPLDATLISGKLKFYLP